MKNAMVNMLLFGALALMITGCGPSKEDADEATPTYESSELMKMQEVSGVYTATADVDYGFDNLIKGSEWGGGSNDLKVSINHSGSDANRQLIVRVESVPAEGKKAESFCTVWNNVAINSKNQMVTGESTESAGAVIDATMVNSFVLTAATEDTPTTLKSMTIGSKALQNEKLEELTKTDEPVLSFGELNNSCFSEEEAEAEANEEEAGEAS